MSEDRPEQAGAPSDASVRARFPSHISHAGDLAVPLSAFSIGLAVLAAVNAAVGRLYASASLTAVIGMMALAAVLLGAAAITTLYRRRIISEALHLAELARERERRQSEQSRSMFTTDMSPEDEAPIAVTALEAYGRTVQPLALTAYSLGIAAIAVLGLWRSGASGEGLSYYLLALLNLGASFLCMVGARWFATYDSSAYPEANETSSILRATLWYSILGAIALVAHGVGFLSVDMWAGKVLLLILLALAGEQVARSVLNFVGKRRSWEEMRAPIGLVIAESLFAGANPIVGTLEVLEKKFGVSVRSSYVLRYVRQTVPLVLGAMLLTFWVMSCFVVVQPDEVGVRTTFGRKPTNCWMDPGLRVKWPWPVDHVERVPARRIQAITIGHEAAQRVPYLLWSKAHAEGEYKLVLGEGRELVSLEAEVYYYIKDPVQYVFNSQNPLEILKSLAYRVLMRETVSEDLDRVLSQARSTFSPRFTRALQQELDAHGVGIAVVQVPLRGIHPPIEIASAYQAVVSAQVERVTLGTKAKAKRAEAIPMAEADKDTAIKGAGAAAAERLGKAKGEAAQFRSVEKAYSLAPALYKERLWLERLEKAIAGKQVYLVEGHKGGSRDYWLDLREQKKPEFP